MPKTQKTNKNFRDKRPDKAKEERRAVLAQAKAVLVIERRYRVVELKRDGYTHKMIANELGIDVTTVSKDLTEVLTETVNEYKLTTELERQMQVEKLDQLIRAFTKYATEPHDVVVVDRQTKQQQIVQVPPDPEFARLILAIEDRRARLLGLDAPTKVDVDSTAIREYVGVDMRKV